MTRNRSAILSLLLAATALGAVATANARVQARAVVKTAFVKALGKPIVVDAHGRTLYEFESDPPGFATCVGDEPAAGCGRAWPPYTTTGAPQAGTGIRSALLGTTKRKDGRIQVTYKRHPLYYFAGYGGTPADKKAGDAHGQGFYNLWYVLSPSGAIVRTIPKR